MFAADVRDELPAWLARALTPAPAPAPAAAVTRAPEPSAGSYTNLFEERHAYMNRSLEVELAALPAGGAAGSAAAGGALSASRLRLLHDTTMIDAALDLDEPEPPRHLPPGPAPVHALRAL